MIVARLRLQVKIADDRPARDMSVRPSMGSRRVALNRLAEETCDRSYDVVRKGRLGKELVAPGLELSHQLLPTCVSGKGQAWNCRSTSIGQLPDALHQREAIFFGHAKVGAQGSRRLPLH